LTLFGVKFAKFLNKPMFFKTPISQHPLIGKFQNRGEMKVNYPTNKENTHTDFSDNFHNIKNFVQVDRRFKISKNSFFPFLRSRKILGDRKIFAKKLLKWVLISARKSCKNFRKFRPQRASQFELKPDWQSYWIRQ
jgi:hypothetical protein